MSEIICKCERCEEVCVLPTHNWGSCNCPNCNCSELTPGYQCEICGSFISEFAQENKNLFYDKYNCCDSCLLDKMVDTLCKDFDKYKETEFLEEFLNTLFGGGDIM